MAYFPLFVDLEGRQVLVVGGGKIAMRRVRTLLEFGCEITVVSPEVCEELREKVLWKKKRYASNRDQCDFYFPGIAKDGDTVVGITSGGGDHRLAAKISAAVRQILRTISV